MRPEVVRAALNAAGIDARVEGYNHETRTWWKVTSDGSLGHTRLGSGGNNGECVSPILRGREGIATLRKVCKVMRDAGARVDVSCGTHVHHDARDFGIDEIRGVVDVYSALRSTIDTMMPASRRSYGEARQWSLPWNSLHRGILASARSIADLHDLAPAHGRGRIPRYHDVNVCAHERYGSIEFRQAAGTLNADRILAWLDVTGAMVEAGSTGRMPSADTLDALAEVADTRGRGAWVRARVAHFGF